MDNKERGPVNHAQGTAALGRTDSHPRRKQPKQHRCLRKNGICAFYDSLFKEGVCETELRYAK